MGRLACRLNVPSVGTLPAQNVTAWHDAKGLSYRALLGEILGRLGPVLRVFWLVPGSVAHMSFVPTVCVRAGEVPHPALNGEWEFGCPPVLTTAGIL